MADHTPVRWIVCYDITDARRGLAVHRCMKRHGLPLQYSVFLVEASPVRLRSLLLELEELISTALDDVRAYRWPERVDLVELGKTMLPGDVWIDIRRQAATQPAPQTARRVAAGKPSRAAAGAAATAAAGVAPTAAAGVAPTAAAGDAPTATAPAAVKTGSTSRAPR